MQVHVHDPLGEDDLSWLILNAKAVQTCVLAITSCIYCPLIGMMTLVAERDSLFLHAIACTLLFAFVEYFSSFSSGKPFEVHHPEIVVSQSQTLHLVE